MSKKPLTNKEGEVRELTAKDMLLFRPAKEVLPAELYHALTNRKRGERGQQKAPTKQSVTLRLDDDVVRYFKASGSGWQTRINNFLKSAVENLGNNQ